MSWLIPIDETKFVILCVGPCNTPKISKLRHELFFTGKVIPVILKLLICVKVISFNVGINLDMN